ncbi:MAG: NAD(P)/FAD-dependent oxidoreductase, partial [Mesorhizobium sp.]
SLREEGYDGPVILIGAENELPYHKPPLSKTFIKDAEARPQPLRGEAFYSGNAIDYRPGVWIDRIDNGARRLDVSGGAAIFFDRL